VLAALARHSIGPRPEPGPIAERFPEPCRLTIPVLRSLYDRLGLSAPRHVELLTGVPEDQVLDALHAAGIPVRPLGSFSPWRQRQLGAARAPRRVVVAPLVAEQPEPARPPNLSRRRRVGRQVLSIDGRLSGTDRAAVRLRSTAVGDTSIRGRLFKRSAPSGLRREAAWAYPRGEGRSAAMAAVLAVVCGATGLGVGPVLGALAHRVGGHEAVAPLPHCWACHVAVVAWVLHSGRCRRCGARTPARHPLAELTSAMLLAAAEAMSIRVCHPTILALTTRRAPLGRYLEHLRVGRSAEADLVAIRVAVQILRTPLS